MDFDGSKVNRNGSGRGAFSFAADDLGVGLLFLVFACFARLFSTLLFAGSDRLFKRDSGTLSCPLGYTPTLAIREVGSLGSFV